MAKHDYGSGRLEQRGNKRWRVTVELPPNPRTGKRRRRRFAVQGTKREAQQALRDALAERDTGFAGAPAGLTAGEWIESWLRRHHADGHITDVTQARYAVAIEAHIVPAIGAIKLGDLRQDHIADLKSAWITGENSTSRGPQAPATVKKQLGVLRQALDAAVQAGLIIRNPASHVKAPPITADDEKRALTEEEIRQLLAAAEGTPFSAALRFSLATGVREGELLGLPWDAVDFSGSAVHIRRSLSRVGHAQFNEPKARSRRTLELSPTTIEVMRAHRVEQNERRLRLGEIWTDNGLVFPSRVGTPRSPRRLLRGFRSLLTKTDIASTDEIDWYTLRHTAASHWIAAGVSTFEVARRLGHSSTNITERVYAHLLPGGQEKSSHALDHLIG